MPFALREASWFECSPVCRCSQFERGETISWHRALLNLSGHLLDSPIVAPWFFPSTCAGASLARGLFPSVDRRWMGGSASAGWDRSKWQLSLFLRNTHVQNYFVTRFTFRMCLCFYWTALQLCFYEFLVVWIYWRLGSFKLLSPFPDKIPSL